MKEEVKNARARIVVIKSIASHLGKLQKEEWLDVIRQAVRMLAAAQVSEGVEGDPEEVSNRVVRELVGEDLEDCAPEFDSNLP
jgi:hypothetical protein